MRPLCFVLMPFGGKKDASGKEINFDAVYEKLIAPAIEEAGLEPLRADEEMTGIIHKPMLERLLLCEYAVADLTTANANVFYELGVRHAARQKSTVLIFADSGGRLPFDVAPLRALPYQLDKGGAPANINESKSALAQRLIAAKDSTTDSPLFELVDDYPDIQHTKTDVFREKVEYSQEMKKRLFEARKKGRDALKEIENELDDIKDVESGVVIDLFLSYRSVSAWEDMVALAEKMSTPLANTVMVREQTGFALNRTGNRAEAINILEKVVNKHGPSSETLSIWGRVYKDMWEEALKEGATAKARGFLKNAVGTYLQGFESDWRDAYPGVNAVTLMELSEPPDERRTELLPVVTYAVQRRIVSGNPDYWDHATLVELAVLQKNEQKAKNALADALAAVREKWEPETTARNLRLIREARDKRGEVVKWARKIEEELTQAAERREK